MENNQNDQTLKSNFPLKFCGHRWLENGKCLTRFMDLIDKLSVFLKKSKMREGKTLMQKMNVFLYY